MPSRSECIHAWVDILNHQSTDDATRFLHPDVVVTAYQQGCDGPATTYEGIDAVARWIERPPPGRFTFTLTSAIATDGLVDGSSVTLSANYRVDHNESDFTNTGKWILQWETGRIRSIRHIPENI